MSRFGHLLLLTFGLITAALSIYAERPRATAVVMAFEYGFIPREVNLPPGKVRFIAENRGLISHTFLIEGRGKDVYLEPGESYAFDIRLGKGTYRLTCTIPGHSAAGMEATITVGR